MPRIKRNKLVTNLLADKMSLPEIANRHRIPTIQLQHWLNKPENVKIIEGYRNIFDIQSRIIEARNRFNRLQSA